MEKVTNGHRRVSGVVTNKGNTIEADVVVNCSGIDLLILSDARCHTHFGTSSYSICYRKENFSYASCGASGFAVL